MSGGTSVEVALAIKAQKQVVLVRPDAEAHTFFEKLSRGAVRVAPTAIEAMQIVLEGGTASRSEFHVPSSQ